MSKIKLTGENSGYVEISAGQNAGNNTLEAPTSGTRLVAHGGSQDVTLNADLTVSGNVSIGGTLTYEDVTNIDSVGIITAKAGINISGGTITGNGSGLTNLPAGQLTGALPAIDGSNLTGIAADKIFEGNTEVETVDTGSNGHIKFTTEGTEALRIDASGRLLLGTTTEGKSAADNLTIADAANSGVTIRSGATNFGSIYFSDATTGAGEYDGYIQYSQNTQYLAFGVAQVERLRIDSAGRLGLNQTSINSSRMMEIKQPASYTSALRINTAGSAGNPGYIEWFSGVSNYKMGVDHNSDNLRIKRDGTTQIRIDSAGNFNLESDTAKFTAGAGNDLQMYHASNNSFITHTGPGQLFITNETSGQDVVLRADNGGSLATYLLLDSSAGEVKINHAGSLKLATKSTGIDVTGTANITGNVGVQTTYPTSSTLVGAGSSLIGMYVGDGHMLFSDNLSRSGGYYVPDGINALNAGPVTLSSTMTLDGVWVII